VALSGEDGYAMDNGRVDLDRPPEKLKEDVNEFCLSLSASGKRKSTEKQNTTSHEKGGYKL
jgi:hypothetical protein